MPKLAEILEKKEFIKKAANLFGFEKIRIYYKNEEKEHTLNLVVSNIKDKENYLSAFEAALSCVLDCQIVVLPEQELKELYQADVLSHSANIDDDISIKKLFGSSFSGISFNSYSSDIKYKNSHQRALELAEKIIEKNTSQSFTDFFKLGKEQNIMQNKENFINKIENAGEEFFLKISEIAKENGEPIDNILIKKVMDNFESFAKKHGIKLESVN